jgi:prepilin-type N-terminal cleavage/methylation domain-containing protein
MNSKAFTLVEMLVVIIIIGVIISMTMYFSLDRLQQLQGQTAKEQFVSDIKFLRTHTLASSLYD